MVTGNRNILNSIKGITSVVKLTAEEKTALADRVLPANVLVVDSSNIVYLTDGVTAVKALNPLLASSNNYAYDKDVVHLTGDETIAGTKTFSDAIVGSVTGNAGSATKLATARTINGTSFNGTANITTANWGTARNISITDGTNTSTAVSVNGSANVSLKLPATIKANLTGNSDTATKATQDSAGQQIDTTYIKGLAVSGRTITYTKGDGTTGTITTQDTNTDTKVTQTVTTTNTEYPVLFSADANKTATSTTTARFSSNIKINPSTNTITATTFKGNLTGNVTGNASTAATAATATNATYANWLRTSSHSDYLFHTEWDKAGYFWTYVTAGNGDYRAVRVARSDSAATATKLATKRTIALSGAATGTATGFDGTANIAIPVTSLDASKLTGTASVSTTGNAATATTATTAKSCTGNAATATKATQDSAGQQIDTTYIKGLAVSGRTITYTKGDGTTGTITTQDTNTWTAFKGATASANGTAGYVPAPTKGNQDKFFKADGTWATPPNTTYASMSASEATTGTATAARTISAKVLHDKINSNLSAYATKTELNNGLATKANNSEVVHKSGDETIAGTKTFSDNVHASGFHSTSSTSFMAQYGEYTLVLRNDGSNTYLLMSDKGGVPGTWSSARPLVINNSTGVCDINGNAATATNATNAAKLGNIASSGYVQTGKVNQTINGTKTFSAAIASSIKTNSYIDGNKGVAIINSTAPAGYNMLYRIKSTNGVFTGGVFNQNYELHYTVDTTIAANTNAVTYTTTLMNEAGDATFAKNVTIGVGLTVKGDANFANITTNYITGLFTE